MSVVRSAAKELLIVNGSPYEGGTTVKCLEEYAQFLCKKYKLNIIRFAQIPVSLQGCQDCKSGCKLRCRFNDVFQNILDQMESCDYVIFGSPVYLDMPTGQMVNLLTRLNCMAENTNRKWFKNKKAFFLATSYCSGTKSVIHTMMGAAEMLGFTILGRSSREYIKLWKDTKIRGGVKGEELLFRA